MATKKIQIKHKDLVMLTARKVNPFWINVFETYENLSDRVGLNSASELLIESLFLNNKFKINVKSSESVSFLRMDK